MNYLPLQWLRRSWRAGRVAVIAGAVGATTTIFCAEPPPGALPANSTAPVLTLDEAIARALRNNQRIKVSDFGRGIGRANVVAEFGHFDPAITFRRSYSESESELITVGNISALTQTDDYSLALTGLTPWGLSYQLGGQSENQRGTYNQFSNNFVTFGGLSVTQPLLRGFGFGQTSPICASPKQTGPFQTGSIGRPSLIR